MRLLKKVLANGGRWCNLTMKATGEVFKVRRTGYKSFEDFDCDSCELLNEDGKFKYTHIKAVMMDEGYEYYTFGKYEINENAIPYIED